MDKLQRYQPGSLSRLDRIKEALRSYWLGPMMSSDPHAREFFGGGATATGVSVDEFSAMNYSAVYAAVQLISSQVGNLPLVLYKKLPGGGKERFEGHPLYRLVHDRPNADMSSLVWRETSQAHVLTWGNLYSEIVRNGAGRPAALLPITPDRVTPFRRGVDSELTYRVVKSDGSDAFIPSGDMIHVPGLGYNGIVGYSVIAKMRESIGLGLAAERFGGTFFGNGASFGGVISYPGPKPPEMSDKNYRDSINGQHQGVDRAHKFLALFNGAEYQRLGIPPNDAQFLETRQFQVDEIARWFNLPPHKLKELMRSTNNNIEHQNLEYYIDCLSPWLERWEQELCEKLISPLERNQQEIEFVADGLLRGDVTSRGDFYSKQFSVAGIKPNELRASENRNPIDGGDDAFVALNLIPLRLAAPYFEAQIDSIKAKAEADRRPPPTPIAPAAPSSDPAKQREIELLTEARDTARRCAQEAEDAKDVIAAELATVRAELAHTQAERDSERTAHEATSERLTAEATRLAQDLGKAVTDIRSDQELASGVAGQRDEARERLLHLEESLLGASNEIVDLKAHVEALREREVATGVAIVAMESERTDLTAALATSESVAAELRSQIEGLREHVDEGVKANAELRGRIATNTELFEAECLRAAEARTHADEVNQATVTELRAQVATLTENVTAGVADVVAVRVELAAAQVQLSERDTELRAIGESTKAQAADSEELRGRLSAAQLAIRGTVVDAANRLIAKEAERARRAQATPEKLGKWAETFYPIHEDFCRVALKPAVRALLIAQGSDAPVDDVLDRIVQAHVLESSRQLQGVVQDSDMDTLPQALERVLRRWESERAETLADRIMKEAA